jgi:hypothetical protein
VDGTCSTRGRHERCLQDFDWKTLNGSDHVVDKSEMGGQY